MIYSNNLFEVLRSMRSHRTQKVNKKNQSFFPKKLLMGKMDNLIKLPQIYATSYFMTHSIDICDMLINMMRCNKKVNVTFKFTKYSLLGKIGNSGQIWSKILQHYISRCDLRLLFSFRFLRYFSMIGHNRYTKAIS